jgi:hypothetical protein
MESATGGSAVAQPLGDRRQPLGAAPAAGWRESAQWPVPTWGALRPLQPKPAGAFSLELERLRRRTP